MNYLILITTILVISACQAPFGESAKSSTNSFLTGTWLEYPCNVADDSSINVRSIFGPNNSITARIEVSFDLNCQNIDTIREFSGTYQLTGVDQSGLGQNIDFSFTSEFVVYASDAALALANNFQYCNRSNWVKGVRYEASAENCLETQVPMNSYNIVKLIYSEELKQQVLVFGVSSGNPLNRPTAYDEDRPVIRIK